jgi:DNA-3-methyladenine glycosylase
LSPCHLVTLSLCHLVKMLSGVWLLIPSPSPLSQESFPKIAKAFFRRPALQLARDLLGAVLIHRYRGKELRARIVETEAYVGPHDLACHAAKGRTKRTEVMFGPGGHAYVYLIYGIHQMFNIVSGAVEDPQAVLIRAAEPLNGWRADLSGPGKLTRAMHISRVHNGLDLSGDQLFLRHDSAYQPRIVQTTRIGVDYAKEWKNALFRFLDENSPAVSRPPKNNG